MTAAGGAKPRSCQAMQPSIIHWRMPGHSSLSRSSNFGVALIQRDGDREWHHDEPAADRLVDGAQDWLVVAGDEQFELGLELEKVLPHEASRNPVASRQRLDAGFRPFHFFAAFNSDLPLPQVLFRAPQRETWNIAAGKDLR
jgi:hypothetical protein